jgi:hypothetical protein
MDDKEYDEIGRYIWQAYVPNSGQSKMVQGELLRAIEKLRDEAMRNGNVNWDDGFVILAHYIVDTLSASNDISSQQKVQLKSDVDRILDYDHPYLEDDLYDRITHVIIDWYLSHKDPIPRKRNPKLDR